MPGTATATGRVVKQVHCACGHDYCYVLEISKTGSYCGFTLTQEQADTKAAENAALELAEELETSCGLCRCPKCGSLTPEMEAKRQVDRASFFPRCLGGTLLGAAISGVAYLVYESSGRLYYVLGAIGLGVLGVNLLVLITGYHETFLEPLDEEAPPRPAEVREEERIGS
jgi:hypothetical protein